MRVLDFSDFVVLVGGICIDSGGDGPGDGPVEVSEVAGGPAYAVVTEATAGDFYVMVDATNYVVTQV